MRLSQTQKHWEKFSRTDPLWAILTVPGKEGNRWDIGEFFRTGVETVDAELQSVRRHHAGLRTGCALDFGCGAGRLTQALARHFDRVTGVDISEGMLELARRHNSHGERVSYVLNTTDDLRQFADGQFDFVYSLITLQHMAPSYARRYIAEFVRITAPGGAILFQMPAVRLRRPFTLWPDRLARRLYRDLRKYFGTEPVMEMHALPRTEVETALGKARARPIHCYRHEAAGPDWKAGVTSPSRRQLTSRRKSDRQRIAFQT